MEINVLIDEDLEGCLEADWLERVTGYVLAAEKAGPAVELGLVITSQEQVRQLNRDYRGKDEPTDVLSFAMLPGGHDTGTEALPFVTPPDEMSHLGEVIISYPQAVIQAGEHRHSVKREIAILVVHGVLHLLGYDHEEPGPEQEMQAREAAILGRIEAELDLQGG